MEGKEENEEKMVQTVDQVGGVVFGAARVMEIPGAVAMVAVAVVVAVEEGVIKD